MKDEDYYRRKVHKILKTRHQIMQDAFNKPKDKSKMYYFSIIVLLLSLLGTASIVLFCIFGPESKNQELTIKALK